MDKNRAWKLLEDISFVRVAGTKEELKAAMTSSTESKGAKGNGKSAV